MAVVQNLYQIFKLPASYVVSNDCNIEAYSLSQGLKEGNVVSIGDNIIFQQLRYIHNDMRDHREVFSYVQKLRNNIHIYKKKGCYKEAHILEQKVCQVLFVSDIVNVVIDGKKSDFHAFRTKGFYLNGVHYVYLCSGSGQIRRNTATFVNEEYHDRLVKTINCGLDEKTSQFVLAKYTAYFALAFSSILWVRTPRVCVVKDFFNTLKDEPVDFIEHDAEGRAYLEERHMDIELNGADGQGLIDPSFAQCWSKDMDLSYTPCSFVVRSCFVKGNLATFDFKDYAHQHGISTIRDRWGKEYNIDDIDVILSESQFKTHKYYSSWQEYDEYRKRGNIHWGVARYNKRVDEEYILANYQYIQSLTLSEEDIQELIQPTIEWIKDICSGDPFHTLLYSFGNKDQGVGYDSVYSVAQTTAMKAVVKDINFLQDSYVQHKIYKNIAETINRAKIGKIWIRGNYQFMVSDPVAQCQAALGMEPVGLLKRDEVYSKFWNDRTSEEIVDLCRSPMIDTHEHNPSKLHRSDDAAYWYKYMTSGIIFSVHDTATLRAEDADFDGDIILSTDNKFFIKGSHKDHNVITYEKGLAVPNKMTTANITKTVMKGFGSGVGGFSNTATIMYAMAAVFNNPDHQDQYNEIMTRIKLLREIVGQEIDRIKGADKPSLPAEWKKYQKITPNDTPEEINEKMRKNAMVVSKKPYFFRYLYPELNQRFKLFESSYNQISRDLFGIKFKKLFKKENKTEEEKMLIRRYQKYSPLITSPCTMNKLCRAFENVDFDIRFCKDEVGDKKEVITLLPSYADLYSDKFDKERFSIVKKMYQQYCNRSKVTCLNNLLQTSAGLMQTDDYKEIRSSLYDTIINELQDTLSANKISGEEFLYYCHQLSAKYSHFNWGFAWEVLADQIIRLIPRGQSYCPVRDDSGEYECLGLRYSLQDLSQADEEDVQDLVGSLLEDEDSEIPDTSLIKDILTPHKDKEEEDYYDIEEEDYDDDDIIVTAEETEEERKGE